jgi:hypothetical protein
MPAGIATYGGSSSTWRNDSTVSSRSAYSSMSRFTNVGGSAAIAAS